ncbi:hypothetical protein [Anthocerotibacter panamensis]|uniref:hypothetical protein n=1 Tax=Anthocerotibacter panamensis TaxID=2857077 RepID=UPI001C403E55|nr:hypothetical protein [Anthocerotibacter panamensis]
MTALPARVPANTQFLTQFRGLALAIDSRGESVPMVIVPRLKTLGCHDLRLNFTATDQGTLGQTLNSNAQVILTLFLQDQTGAQVQEIYRVLTHPGSPALGRVFSAIVEVPVSAPQVSVSAQAINFPKGRSYLLTTSTYLI